VQSDYQPGGCLPVIESTSITPSPTCNPRQKLSVLLQKWSYAEVLHCHIESHWKAPQEHKSCKSTRSGSHKNALCMADNNLMSGPFLPDMLFSYVWADAGAHHVGSSHTMNHMQKFSPPGQTHQRCHHRGQRPGWSHCSFSQSHRPGMRLWAH